METITLREFSRRHNISVEAVSQAIKDQRLVGSVVRNHKGVPRLNEELALQEWAGNTIPAKNRLGNSIEVDGASYAESRAKREAYNAELARLELEEKQGTLVDAEQVKKDAYATARQVRDGMLNIPDRVAAELAALTDQFEVHRRLTEEIRKALETALSDQS